MITLMTLSILMGIYFNIKVYRDCKEKGIDWNPFKCGLGTWLGFFYGTAFGGISLIFLIIKYLP
jgi:hypothetical protein